MTGVYKVFIVACLIILFVLLTFVGYLAGMTGAGAFLGGIAIALGFDSLQWWDRQTRVKS